MANIEKLKSTSVLKEWRETINELIDLGETFAPESHASTSDIYGVGSGSNYGHVRLCDDISLSYDVLDGIAATPMAVKTLNDSTLKINSVLNANNVASIDGALLQEMSVLNVKSVKAQSFEGTIAEAVKATYDGDLNEITKTYAKKDEITYALKTIERDGLNLNLNSIISNDPSISFLYQNSHNGYMPAINLPTSDGRVGIGTKDTSLLLTYFKTSNQTENTPDSSLSLLSTGVKVTGTLEATKNTSIKGTLSVVGRTSITDDVYLNSDSNSMVLRNTGTSFDILSTTTVNGSPQALKPISITLEHESSTLAGLTTIGGSLHTKGKITAEGKVYNAVWNDYAEFFEKGEETEVGDFIALDLSSEAEVYVKASKENSSVVGVHSDTYGPIIGGTGDLEESERTFIPVGLAGRVRAKITGRIKKGDFVVLSDIPGVGCAYDEFKNVPLDVVGICLEASDDETTKLLKIKIK